MTSALPPTPEPPANLPELVAACLGEPIRGLTKLPGGLSARQFFRVERSKGAPAIAMWLPEDSPERALARRLERRLPFIEVRELLQAAGVRVPALFGAAPELGLLVVEDLGETLAERVAREPPASERLYRRAVEDLAAAQRRLAQLPEQSIVRTRALDRELLTWELQHFREWGVEALGSGLSSADDACFARSVTWVVETVLGFEQGFVHRDYQSRNLLALADDSVGWIDFQDALLGPRAYDLVALLRDSYQSFDEAFVSARLAEYCAASALGPADARAVAFELDVITVQRKLKDAGRFVFFERTRGDASYLRYFVPSLELVLGALARLPPRPELAGLADIVRCQIEIGRSRGMLGA